MVKIPNLKLVESDIDDLNPDKAFYSWNCDKCWKKHPRSTLIYEVEIQYGKGYDYEYKRVCESCAVSLGLKW